MGTLQNTFCLIVIKLDILIQDLSGFHIDFVLILIPVRGTKFHFILCHAVVVIHTAFCDRHFIFRQISIPKGDFLCFCFCNRSGSFPVLLLLDSLGMEQSLVFKVVFFFPQFLFVEDNTAVCCGNLLLVHCFAFFQEFANIDFPAVFIIGPQFANGHIFLLHSGIFYSSVRRFFQRLTHFLRI